ncbi:MAG TPA: hypothetical protein PLV03_02310 [Clostridiales bacterium]|nr:hypothetical protein [Clostridiales bacterium]
MIFIFFLFGCFTFVPCILAIVFKATGSKMTFWQILKEITR